MHTLKQLTQTPLSFLTGMARALDLGNTLDEYDLSAEDFVRLPTDAEMLASDREALREDCFNAYSSVLETVDGQTP
ncbi:MAG TPA: hypothetical protein VF647_14325 [Longimicrobium sp.]|jgi:hypothetical protein